MFEVHIEEFRVLVRRSREFLDEAREAKSKGRFDIACFLAEQAAQLFLKALLLKHAGDYPRTHHVRTLLSELISAIENESAKESIRLFIRNNRARLSELEDAYLMSRYTTKTYTREDAEDIVSTASELINLLSRLLGVESSV